MATSSSSLDASTSSLSVNLPQTSTDLSDILNAAPRLDTSRLNPIPKLPQLDYIYLDDAPVHTTNALIPSRGFSDDITYGTGISYLLALSTGGAWGLVEGLRQSRQYALTTSTPVSFRIQLNSILNSVTRRGPFLGNSVGVLAIGYVCTNALFQRLIQSDEVAMQIKEPGLREKLASVVAAGAAGALFRSTAGPKKMMRAGAIGLGLGAFWQGLQVLLEKAANVE